MPTIVQQFNSVQLKNDLPDIKPGAVVKVHQKIKEGNKERTQIFEGLVIARKNGKGINTTITVRKVVKDVGVEKIFPVHSPLITKIEVVRQGKTRRAKLYYLRTAKGRKAKLKQVEFGVETKEEKPYNETQSANENTDTVEEDKVETIEETKTEESEENKESK